VSPRQIRGRSARRSTSCRAGEPRQRRERGAQDAERRAPCVAVGPGAQAPRTAAGSPRPAPAPTLAISSRRSLSGGRGGWGAFPAHRTAPPTGRVWPPRPPRMRSGSIRPSASGAATKFERRASLSDPPVFFCTITADSRAAPSRPYRQRGGRRPGCPQTAPCAKQQSLTGAPARRRGRCTNPVRALGAVRNSNGDSRIPDPQRRSGPLGAEPLEFSTRPEVAQQPPSNAAAALEPRSIACSRGAGRRAVRRSDSRVARRDRRLPPALGAFRCSRPTRGAG
jgi:hypothetical protein